MHHALQALDAPVLTTLNPFLNPFLLRLLPIIIIIIILVVIIIVAIVIIITDRTQRSRSDVRWVLSFRPRSFLSSDVCLDPVQGWLNGD